MRWARFRHANLWPLVPSLEKDVAPPNPHQFFGKVLEEARAAAGTPALKQIIQALADGAHGNPADPQRVLGWLFAQFIVGAVGASHAVSQYELAETGDWLAWSLTDAIEDGPVQTMHVGRLEEFLDPMISNWPPFSDLYTGWFRDFFYYARSRAAMPEVALAILPVALDNLQLRWNDPLSETLAMAASNLLSWSVQEFPDAAQLVAPLVKQSARDLAVDGRVRLILAMTLAAKPGEALGEDTGYWRALALGELAAWHRSHERLQLLIDEFGSRDDPQLFNDVLQEIDIYQRWVEHHDADDVDVFRGRDALAPLIKVAVRICLSRHQGKRAVDLLAHWYRVGSEAAFWAQELLIQCPFYSEGYLALVDSAAFRVEGDPQEILVALTQASNEFLGTYHTVQGAVVRPHIADRPGVVDESAGATFEARLASAYLPAGLVEQTWTFSGQIVVPSQGHPLQAIQLRHGMTCAPIIASLQQPRPDRPVQRVALWSGAGSMTEELERNAVAAAFRQGGVGVDVVTPDHASVERFLELYEADTYDVVWLMSHGTFDHYSPKRASLVIDENGGEIGISELLKRTLRGDRRRLLVLNVCDGGRFEEIGILPRVGVAPATATAHQATISHLWPVHGISAAIFGTLLAKHLSSRTSFFDAFTHTLRHLSAKKEEQMALLRVAAGNDAEELVSRLANSQIDLTNIAHWGSPVFYA